MDDQLIALAISLVGQNLWLPDATSVAILVLSPLIFLERTPGFPLPSKRGSERPNLHFVGSAEPMLNHDLSGRTDAEPMPNLNQ